MGVSLKDLINGEEIAVKDLSGQVVAIDAFNMLYQFLTTIRARDGSMLTDSKGRVTSHLIGLFSRLTNFLEMGIKPVFVFDGEPPELKKKERERRNKLKQEAQAKYEIALKDENLEEMKKFSARTTRLTSEMIVDAKALLKALGVPIVDAPSEGEAQTAYMAKQGDVEAAVSQDFDSLLFGCPILIRNLSIAGRRKKIHGIGTTTVKPQRIVLSDVLNELSIDQDGLIALGMLVGTDFNYGGIKGIGPKKALALVQKHLNDYETLFKEVKWDEIFPMPWTEVFYLFKKMPTTDYTLKWDPVDKEKLIELLVNKHDFTEERVNSSLEKLKKQDEKKSQKGLGDFM